MSIQVLYTKPKVFEVTVIVGSKIIKELLSLGVDYSKYIKGYRYDYLKYPQFIQDYLLRPSSITNVIEDIDGSSIYPIKSISMNIEPTEKFNNRFQEIVNQGITRPDTYLFPWCNGTSSNDFTFDGDLMAVYPVR